MDLSYVKPLTRRHNVVLRKGTFSGAGGIEYTPSLKVCTPAEGYRSRTENGLYLLRANDGRPGEGVPDKSRARLKK